MSKKLNRKVRKKSKNNNKFFVFFSLLFNIFKFLFVFLFYILTFIIVIFVSFFKKFYSVFLFLFDKIKNKGKSVKTKSKNRVKGKSKKSVENFYVPFKILKKFKGNFDKFESLIYDKSSIGIILGARGTGKTALGLKLLENYYYKKKFEEESKSEDKYKKSVKNNNVRKLFALGFENVELPFFIQKVKDPVFLEENSIVLLDESGIVFSSRKGFSDINTLMSDLILISRHKNLSLIFISQNSSNLDVNILRQADYLLLKPSSLLQLDFERKKIKDIYKKVSEDFGYFKNVKGLTYIYSEPFVGFVKNPLPSFWNDNISKSFKNK